MKILTVLAANLGRIHWLNEKIEVLYDLWSSAYRKISPLIPQHVAATAAATAAVQEAAAPEPETAEGASE